jgi:hypothetical protein
VRINLKARPTLPTIHSKLYVLKNSKPDSPVFFFDESKTFSSNLLEPDMTSENKGTTAKAKRRTTEEFASSQLVLAQTVRKRLCETGSYFGITPTKLPNGRLAWPPE